MVNLGKWMKDYLSPETGAGNRKRQIRPACAKTAGTVTLAVMVVTLSVMTCTNVRAEASTKSLTQSPSYQTMEAITEIPTETQKEEPFNDASRKIDAIAMKLVQMDERQVSFSNLLSNMASTKAEVVQAPDISGLEDKLEELGAQYAALSRKIDDLSDSVGSQAGSGDNGQTDSDVSEKLSASFREFIEVRSFHQLCRLFLNLLWNLSSQS